MKQLIQHFERSYIINLSDRVDRRQQAELEFRSVGIDIPNNFVQFYAAKRPTERGTFPDIGTRGCFDSHRRILELAHREHLRNVLIFEDDVSFRNVGVDFERKLLKQLSRVDWDVVYFGYGVPNDSGLSGPLIQWTGDVLGAHFYGVNGRFIPQMLQYMNECELRPRDHPEGGPMPADGAYNHVRRVFPNVKLLISVPNLAHQRSSRTDIGQKHILDKFRWLSPIVRRARSIKHRFAMASDTKRLRRRLNETSKS